MNNASAPRFTRLIRLIDLALSIVLWAAIAVTPAQAQSLRDMLSEQTLIDAPLQPEDAFRLTATPLPGGGLALEWQIEDGYYLYRDYLAAATPDGTTLVLETPTGISKAPHPRSARC